MKLLSSLRPVVVDDAVGGLCGVSWHGDAHTLTASIEMRPGAAVGWRGCLGVSMPGVGAIPGN